jgi:hypothetical protein
MNHFSKSFMDKDREFADLNESYLLLKDEKEALARDTQQQIALLRYVAVEAMA